jgi:ABC-2 type transport system permease protein
MKYAQLIRLLVGRELTLRYKRSVIGIGWTLLNPLLTSFVLWIVFSYVFASRLPSGQQYAPFLLAGILMNTFFNQGLLGSANSIAGNGGILTKIYIPPQVFAVSSALAAMCNFFLGLIPLVLVVYISGQSMSLFFPLAFVLGFFMALMVAGLGLCLSILFIRFDDTQNIVSVLLMTLLYFTPVFYPVSALNPTLQSVIRFNPLTSYLDIFRWAFSNNSVATLSDWLFVILTSLLSMALGIFVFKKYWPRTVTLL